MSGRRPIRALLAFFGSIPLTVLASLLVMGAGAVVASVVMAVFLLVAGAMPLVVVAAIVLALWSPQQAAQMAEAVKVATTADRETVH